jgi:hypothetical protein
MIQAMAISCSVQIARSVSLAVSVEPVRHMGACLGHSILISSKGYAYCTLSFLPSECDSLRGRSYSSFDAQYAAKIADCTGLAMFEKCNLFRATKNARSGLFFEDQTGRFLPRFVCFSIVVSFSSVETPPFLTRLLIESRDMYHRHKETNLHRTFW